MSLKKVIEQIKKHNNFLITSHVNLEGDALGSELAFYRLISALNKKAVLVNEDNLPYGYDFFSGADLIKKYKPDLEGIRFDCFVAVDCSDLKRTGEVYRLNVENKPVLNIDHHASNTNFGHYNWVDSTASSCCEMVYGLYKKLGVKIDKDAALPLYVGMLTDTGSFRYSNTTSRTHKIVSELLKCDLNVNEIYKKVYGNLPFGDMKSVAAILNSIKRRCQGKIVWFEVKAAMLKKYKILYADLTDFTMSYARSIKDTEVAVLFKENLGVKKEVRVNFRSQGKVDVNKIANFFGGGGHKTASGCTLHGSLEEIKARVLKKIEISLKEAGI